MARNLTQNQIESIVLDTAVLYTNYGEASQAMLGITKGGVEFNVTESLRDIEYDGRRGKTMGMEVVDAIDAYLKTTTLEITNDNIFLALGAATKASGTGKITNTTGGVIAASRYLTNITAFGYCNKTSTFKKITIYNVLAPGGLTITTADKSEAGLPLQFNAHWNPMDYTDPVYEVEDDVAGPQTTTPNPLALSSSDPADSDTGVLATVTPTLTFNNAIDSSAISLIKAADGSIVSATVTWDATKKIATLTPASSLAAGGVYHIIAAGVKDIYGQTLATTVIVFTVAE